MSRAFLSLRAFHSILCRCPATLLRAPNCLLHPPYSSTQIFSSDSIMHESTQSSAEADISANPQNVGAPDPGARHKSVDPAEYSILREGEADILMHGNDVFYNKAQIVSRDLSIAVLRAFVIKWQEEHLSKQEKAKSNQNTSTQHSDRSSSDAKEENLSSKRELNDMEASQDENDAALKAKPENTSCAEDTVRINMKRLRILEALAASGLRAIRYAREVEGVDFVVALDKDEVAVEACKRNIKLNGKVAISKVQVAQGDARIYMLNHEKKFDVVDIDPYGSPCVFLDSAMQCVADGGLLMCTATDMAVLCGNYGETCYTKYGSYSLRGKYCHEMAARILLSCIESHANRYKRHIVPLLSVSVDFYVRVFVRIFTSASSMKASPSKLSYVYQCVGCDSFHLQKVGRISQKDNKIQYKPGTGPVITPDCKQCGKHFEMGGPIWSDPIHDPEWISSIFKALTISKHRYPAFDKVHALLTAVSEELHDVPLFLSLHSISATLKCVCPSTTLMFSALVNAGYRTSCSHASPLALKTDAPMDVIWDIMRCWVRLHPVKTQPVGTPGSVILSKDPALQANFSKALSTQSKIRKKNRARFLPNPEAFWGPKPRAGRKIKSFGHSHWRKHSEGSLELKRLKKESSE